eukprot:11216743-Lingulodinium_polyedra.AAC.1
MVSLGGVARRGLPESLYGARSAVGWRASACCKWAMLRECSDRARGHWLARAGWAQLLPPLGQ